jgi:hypothetical protein
MIEKPTLNAFIRSVSKKVEGGKPPTLAEARRLRNVGFERKRDEALISYFPPVDSKNAEQAFFARLSRDSGATSKRKRRMPWKRLLRIIRDRLVKIVEYPQEKPPAKNRATKQGRGR